MRYTITPTRDPMPEMVEFCNIIIQSGYIPIILCETTYDNIPLPKGTIFLQKTGTTFNSWVNQGLDHVATIDPDGVCVSINSDIVVAPDALHDLFKPLEDNTATLTALTGWENLTGGITPLRGHLWGINPHKGLRLKEIEGLPLWWWNTDILYREAIQNNHPIKYVNVQYTHISDNEGDGAWHYPEEFADGAQEDHDYYWETYWEQDPNHTSCYWNNWPQSIPEGQTHKINFNPNHKELPTPTMKIYKTEYPIHTAQELLEGLQSFYTRKHNLNKLKPRNPSITFTDDGQLHMLLPAAKYAIRPATNPQTQNSYWEHQEGETNEQTRIYYANLTNHQPGKPVNLTEIKYANHECYDPRIHTTDNGLEVLLHNNMSKKMETWTLNIDNHTMTYKTKHGIHHANRRGMREKNWMTTPDGRYIVDHTTIANPRGHIFKKQNSPQQYDNTRGGGQAAPLHLPTGETILVAVTHKIIPRENNLPIYTNQFTYYNPSTLQIITQTPNFKFSNQAVEFTSGFTISPDNQTAYIGYGVSDWEAHVDTLPTSTLINLYYANKGLTQ